MWQYAAAAAALFAPTALAQKTPYENLVLADCGIGLGVNGGSTSREMIYYSGDVWTGNGLDTYKPQMMVNVPWSGEYPWGQKGGVKATMPNGDTFSVYINKDIHDPDAAGDAWHTYEQDKPLKCYSYHWDRLYQLDDGKWCSSAYVCNHRGKPYIKPGGQPAPPSGPDTQRITASTNSDWVDLYSQSAKNVIATVNDRFKHDSYNCDNSAVSIGSGCTITWKCHGDAGMRSIERMSAAFASIAAEPKFSETYTKTSEICRRFDSRPGKEGQCLAWETKTDNYVRLPGSLDMVMDNVPPAGSGRNPSVHGGMSYEIKCSKSSLACKACNIIGYALSVPSALAGAAVSISCTVSPFC